MAARHASEQQLGYFRHYLTRRGRELRLVRMARGGPPPIVPPSPAAPVNSSLEAIRNKRTSFTTNVTVNNDLEVRLNARHVNRCRSSLGGAGRQRFTWRQTWQVVAGVVVLVSLWAGVAFWMAIVEAMRFGWTQ